MEELERLVEQLQRRGKRQAAPFSRDAPKPEPDKPGRRAGKDYGRWATRGIPERVDREVAVPLPPACPHCGNGQLFPVSVLDQYQEEIEARTVVTRFRVEVGRCADCGKRVQGHHPEQASSALGAASSGIGPEAVALAAWLHTGLGLSFGKCTKVLARFGLDITPGGLAQALRRLAHKAEPTYRALMTEARASPVLSPDETGWRVGGVGAWLWVFATPLVVVAAVRSGRGFSEAASVLGENYAGVLVRDGWAPYRRFEAATHQTCLAHLLRRCQELSETLPRHHRFVPRRLWAILDEALWVRDQRKGGELEPAKAAEAVATLEGLVEDLLRRRPSHPANRRLLRHLGRERDALFTFLHRPGVDATNWRAEQAVRPLVVNRKTWGGNRTWAGARTQEIIASVVATAGLQHLQPVSVLADLLRSPAPAVAPFILPHSQAESGSTSTR